jgi:hypothetical protein
MTSAGGLRQADGSNASASEAVTAQPAVAISSCSRLGRTANPPGFSLLDWLRPLRRR